MKLILATPLYPPDSGGPATDAALLARELPAYGIETVVCSFGSVRHLPRGIRHLVYASKLLKLARGTDGIISFDTFSVCIPAAYVARKLRIPLIVRVPGDFAWEQARQRFGVTDSLEEFQQKKYGARIERFRTLQRTAVNQAALVVVPSDYFLHIFEEWKLTAPLKRIYLGIDPLDPEQYKHAPLQKVPQGKILFSVGRFVPWKGFASLIELMPSLPKEWYLVLAGNGPQEGELKRKVQELALQDRVTFTGKLLREDVLAWLTHADAFVLNTSFESFSFQVLEAMACGVPVITTNIGSLPELITNGVEGVLCAPNDMKAFAAAVESTVSEPEAWKQRTQAAQEKSQRFSTKASLDAFVEALREVIT